MPFYIRGGVGPSATARGSAVGGGAAGAAATRLGWSPQRRRVRTASFRLFADLGRWRFAVLNHAAHASTGLRPVTAQAGLDTRHCQIQNPAGTVVLGSSSHILCASVGMCPRNMKRQQTENCQGCVPVCPMSISHSRRVSARSAPRLPAAPQRVPLCRTIVPGEAGAERRSDGGLP
jgi:hypothetical protein